jgi:hypothetical protein
MTETLINRKTAELARSKGFLLSCDSFYCENYEGLCMERDEFLWVESLDNPIYDCNCEFEEGERYYATTQDLLQKWLREVHNIRVYPTQKIAGDFGFEIYIKNEENPAGSPFKRVSYFTQHFNSYEEAIEKGLQEALNLIILNTN